jgi:hypothetical protein
MRAGYRVSQVKPKAHRSAVGVRKVAVADCYADDVGSEQEIVAEPDAAKSHYSMVPEVGVEPTRCLGGGFSCHFGFRRPRGPYGRKVRGLEHAFTIVLRP